MYEASWLNLVKVTWGHRGKNRQTGLGIIQVSCLYEMQTKNESRAWKSSEWLQQLQGARG